MCYSHIVCLAIVMSINRVAMLLNGHGYIVFCGNNDKFAIVVCGWIGLNNIVGAQHGGRDNVCVVQIRISLYDCKKRNSVGRGYM